MPDTDDEIQKEAEGVYNDECARLGDLLFRYAEAEAELRQFLEAKNTLTNGLMFKPLMQRLWPAPVK